MVRAGDSPTRTPEPRLSSVVERNIASLLDRRRREAANRPTSELTLTRALAAKLGVAESHDAELHELAQDVAPERVLDHIEKHG